MSALPTWRQYSTNMRTYSIAMLKFLTLMLCLLGFNVHAQEIGMVKTIIGEVSIQRGSEMLAAKLGSKILLDDKISTGKSSSVGLTLVDGTMLTAGPNSSLSLNKFSFDSTSNKGEIDTTIKKGTLAVISGKISKTSNESVVYRTPTTILAVRGTEFIIDVDAQEGK